MQTSMISIAEYTLIVTGVLVAVGGIIGFIKARSMPSLLAGVVSGILLVVCFIVASQHDAKAGLIGGIVLLAILEAVFTMRFAKTKKFMPSGMLIGICVVSQIITVIGLLQAFEAI
jgi:uncharacterized membrane protein (UPF0136 family)